MSYYATSVQKGKLATFAVCLIVVLSAVQLAAAPPIIASAVQPSCSTQVSNCGAPVATLVQNNGVSVKLDAVTHNFYDSKPAGLTYKIYKATDDPAVATPVVSFTCKKQSLNFHSAKLSDDTTYKLQINAGVVKSAIYIFTTGKPCKNIKPLDNQRVD